LSTQGAKLAAACHNRFIIAAHALSPYRSHHQNLPILQQWQTSQMMVALSHCRQYVSHLLRHQDSGSDWQQEGGVDHVFAHLRVAEHSRYATDSTASGSEDDSDNLLEICKLTDAAGVDGSTGRRSHCPDHGSEAEALPTADRSVAAAHEHLSSTTRTILHVAFTLVIPIFDVLLMMLVASLFGWSSNRFAELRVWYILFLICEVFRVLIAQRFGGEDDPFEMLVHGLGY
jgi:hypothetical protein